MGTVYSTFDERKNVSKVVDFGGLGVLVYFEYVCVVGTTPGRYIGKPLLSLYSMARTFAGIFLCYAKYNLQIGEASHLQLFFLNKKFS